MTPLELTYSISGTPLFHRLALEFAASPGGIKGQAKLALTLAQQERDISTQQAENDNTVSVYFLPSNDQQMEAVLNTISLFSSELEKYTEDQKQFCTDVLVSLYTRNYDLLISEMEKLIESK